MKKVLIEKWWKMQKMNEFQAAMGLINLKYIEKKEIQRKKKK